MIQSDLMNWNGEMRMTVANRYQPNPCVSNKFSNRKLIDSKVLLVEDNEINIKVASLLLRQAGLSNIIVAKNGQDALKLFSNDLSLILLDIGLPDISGIEVCRAIRNKKNGNDILIIAHTADGSLKKEDFLKAGFDDVLIKPVMLNDFKVMIQRYMKNEIDS